MTHSHSSGGRANHNGSGARQEVGNTVLVSSVSSSEAENSARVLAAQPNSSQSAFTKKHDHNMSSALNVILFVGSVRQGRMASRVATWVKSYLETRGVNVTVFDPIEKPYLAAVKQPVHFYPSDPPAELVADNEVIKSADGYVIVCGEYNRCIPPALSAMVDHFPPASYAAKPAASVCYSMGRFGGVSAAIQLREFLTELAMVPTPAITNVSLVHNVIGEDGTPKDSTLESSLKRTVDQLLWYGNVLKTARKCEDQPFPV